MVKKKERKDHLIKLAYYGFEGRRAVKTLKELAKEYKEKEWKELILKVAEYFKEHRELKKYRYMGYISEELDTINREVKMELVAYKDNECLGSIEFELKGGKLIVTEKFKKVK